MSWSHTHPAHPAAPHPDPAHPVHPATVGVQVPVSVPVYIIYTLPQPPQPHPRAIPPDHAVPAIPFIFITVVLLSNTRSPNTSIIRHHHPAHPVQGIFQGHAAPHPDQHPISIHLLPAIAVRGYTFPLTHPAPLLAVPLAPFPAPQPHPHPPHGHTHHVDDSCSICVVAVPLNQTVPHAVPLPLKSNVRLVKSAFHLIFICTTQPVGVTVNVLVAPHATQDE